MVARIALSVLLALGLVLGVSQPDKVHACSCGLVESPGELIAKSFDAVVRGTVEEVWFVDRGKVALVGVSKSWGSGVPEKMYVTTSNTSCGVVLQEGQDLEFGVSAGWIPSVSTCSQLLISEMGGSFASLYGDAVDPYEG